MTASVDSAARNRINGSIANALDVDLHRVDLVGGDRLDIALQVGDTIDFNHDGGVYDPADIDTFLRVFSEGPCQL